MPSTPLPRSLAIWLLYHMAIGATKIESTCPFNPAALHCMQPISKSKALSVLTLLACNTRGWSTQQISNEGRLHSSKLETSHISMNLTLLNTVGAPQVRRRLTWTLRGKRGKEAPPQPRETTTHERTLHTAPQQHTRKPAPYIGAG
jgi:hypothetical protein